MLAYVVWFALAVMLLSRVSVNVIDLDIFHEMALFRESLVLGHIPTVDHFSYGPTLPYVVHQEWGSGAVAYFVATRFGAPGLLLLKYLLAALLAWFCVATARSRTPDPLPALAWVAPIGILFAGAAFSPVRAHLYSLVFAACLLYFLESDRRGNRRWIPIWLPLSALWFNLHAGAVIGVLLLGAYAFEQLLRGSRWLHLPLVAAGMLAGVVVNPYGWHYYPYLWRALRMSRTAIAEWSPLWESFPSFYSVTFLLSLLLLLYLAARIGVRSMPGIVVLCMTAAAGALHQRMLPFYAIAWTCYVPGYLLATPFRRPPEVPLRQAAAAPAGSLADGRHVLSECRRHVPPLGPGSSRRGQGRRSRFPHRRRAVPGRSTVPRQCHGPFRVRRVRFLEAISRGSRGGR